MTENTMIEVTSSMGKRICELQEENAELEARAAFWMNHSMELQKRLDEIGNA